MKLEINQIRKNTALNIVIDTLSAAFVVIFLIVGPIWIHYSPESSRDTNGNMTLVLKLLTADLIPFMFGIIWLLARYYNHLVIIGQKYPFLRTWVKNPFYIIITTVIVLQFFKYVVWG